MRLSRAITLCQWLLERLYNQEYSTRQTISGEMKSDIARPYLSQHTSLPYVRGQIENEDRLPRLLKDISDNKYSQEEVLTTYKQLALTDLYFFNRTYSSGRIWRISVL